MNVNYSKNTIIFIIIVYNIVLYQKKKIFKNILLITSFNLFLFSLCVIQLLHSVQKINIHNFAISNTKN